MPGAAMPGAAMPGAAMPGAAMPGGRVPLVPSTQNAASSTQHRNASPLRVCADPNNLPYSNARQEGFENAIASLVARDLGQAVQYVWQPQRRGFIRKTLKAGRCDVVMSVPAGYELVDTTQPYYTSAYVFVSRHDRHLGLRSFDDARLTRLVVGIQITGEDYNNPPPARALAARHLVDHVRGFPVYGDYSDAAPQRTIIDAVADGRVDAAVVWGPLAGYFASRVAVALDLSPVTPAVDRFSLPFAFDMSMGVARGNEALRSRLNAAIAHRGQEIRAILRHYGVPLVAPMGGRRS
jgi:quinoprotein dehydrogenase-associated probable ABC transporter substrate-binding protein